MAAVRPKIFVAFFATFPLFWALTSGQNYGLLWVQRYVPEDYKEGDTNIYCKPFPIPLGMENWTIPNSQISAFPNEYARMREPWKARLNHESAWQAETNDYAQNLQIDFGRRMVVMGVATQGMRGSSNWITQYRMFYSNDGTNFEPVTSRDGEPQIFDGNNDANTVKKTDLEFPIIAQYVRFNPQRWNGYIAMRVEVYGCTFVSYAANFVGQGHISYDVTGPAYQVRMREDELRIRFRTNTPYGLIFHADSSQGDFWTVELYRGILRTAIALGSVREVTQPTEVYSGSLLDDNQWHDVLVQRYAKQVNITIDRIKTESWIKSDFVNFDIDKTISIGGMPTFTHGASVKSRVNFTGCLENVVYNNLNLIRDAQEGLPRFSLHGSVEYVRCRVQSITPVTFGVADSYLNIELPRGESSIFRAQFIFRTYNVDGDMLFHELQGDGNSKATVLLRIDKNGHLSYVIESSSNTVTDTVENLEETAQTSGFNDGLWHKVLLRISNGKINFTVDSQIRITTQPLTVRTSGNYLIGGGREGYPGFYGCMRDLELANDYINFAELEDDNIVGAEIGACSMRDRCNPNPCENRGLCSQDWNTFYCDCDGTGYEGAVCHLSKHYQTCTEARETNQDVPDIQTMIDVDGSGPLKPFQVKCKFTQDETSATTEVHHRYMSYIMVNGYDAPGEYSLDIDYDANLDQLTGLIQRAYKCRQYISYQCHNSRLLAPPGTGQYKSFGWWVSRNQQPQYYWGDATQGSNKCSCGLRGTCEAKQSRCNCDASLEEAKMDDGYLNDKTYLPVMQLRFGDTGGMGDSKWGKHKLGALECTGDDVFDNVITFRKADATLEFPPLKQDELSVTESQTLDIRFQFKTTSPQGTFIHCEGYGTQFLEVAYSAGTVVQFRFNVGRGVESIEVSTPYQLNDDKWHTVIVERNRKEYFLKVDLRAPETQDEPSHQGYKLFSFEKNFTVGARTDFRDGFTGCMRGLQVNGEIYDLKGMIEKNITTYGLSTGCNPKCASRPCINNGICKEGYSRYDCDCTFTPFRGYICGREVGTDLKSNDMIKYVFDERGTLATEEESITVGFSTQSKQGILMKIVNPDIDEYISLELNNNGGVTCVYNLGAQSGGRQTISTQFSAEIDLTNNQQHVVHFRREQGGRKLILSVDDYPPREHEMTELGTGADTKLNGPKFIYMGRDETTGPGQGFTGCIYRARFNNIYPLKLAFNDPRPPNIILSPPDLREDKCGFEEYLPPKEKLEIRTPLLDREIKLEILRRVEEAREMSKSLVGDLREDMCGFIEILHDPEPFETRVPPMIELEDPRFGRPSQPLSGALIGVIIAVCLLLLFIILLIAIYCLLKSRGGYRTREDKGARGAQNPDFAMINSDTGPDVAPKKEYFI